MQNNQPPPLEPYNLFSSDPTLRDAVVREGAADALTTSRRLARERAPRRSSSGVISRIATSRSWSLMIASVSVRMRCIITPPTTP